MLVKIPPSYYVILSQIVEPVSVAIAILKNICNSPKIGMCISICSNLDSTNIWNQVLAAPERNENCMKHTAPLLNSSSESAGA